MRIAACLLLLVGCGAAQPAPGSSDRGFYCVHATDSGGGAASACYRNLDACQDAHLPPAWTTDGRCSPEPIVYCLVAGGATHDTSCFASADECARAAGGGACTASN